MQADASKVSFTEQLGPNESTVPKHSDSGKLRVGFRLATLKFYFK